MSEEPVTVNYLSTDDILAIHELIVESNDETEAGVSSPGDIDYAVEYVREGHFGHVPESIHEKAFQLLRLIAANHPFVDGNKRTALMSVRIFYALNGLKFDYGREIKDVLKRLATDEADVDAEKIRTYLCENTHSLEPEYDATVQLWLAHIGTAGSRSADIGSESGNRPNDYDNRDPSEN